MLVPKDHAHHMEFPKEPMCSIDGIAIKKIQYGRLSLVVEGLEISCWQGAETSLVIILWKCKT